MVLKVSRWSGKFLDCLNIFLMVRKVSGQSKKNLDCQENFRIAWKDSRQFGLVQKVSREPVYHPDGLESFQSLGNFGIAGKVSGQSGKCPGNLKSVRMVQNYFDDPEKSLIMLKVSRQSSNILDGKTISHVFFLLQKTIYPHIFVAKTIKHTFILQKLFMHTFFVSKRLMHTLFVAKTIHAILLSRRQFWSQLFVVKMIYAFSCRKTNIRTFLSR